MKSKYEKYTIKLKIPQDIEVKIELIRKIAPLTIQAILKNLPFNTRIKKYGKQIILYFPIKFKAEKTTVNVKRSDVAYWPLSQALCIYLEDMRTSSPVILVGKVTEGLNLLAKIASGTGVIISEINEN